MFPSKADWCKNTAECVESMIGMIMRHTHHKKIDIGPTNMSYIKVARGILCFGVKFWIWQLLPLKMSYTIRNRSWNWDELTFSSFYRMHHSRDKSNQQRREWFCAFAVRCLVSNHYLSKALTQHPRNIEYHAKLILLHILHSFSWCNPYSTERALKIDNFYL